MSLSLTDLPCSDVVWEAHAELQARLFLALGGKRDWFRRHVLVRFFEWEARVAGLAWEAQPLVLKLLEEALLTLERCPCNPGQDHPRDRLLAVHREFLRQEAFSLAGVKITDGERVWTPGRGPLRSWRLGTRGPVQLTAPTKIDTRTREAMAQCVATGVWHVGGMGRLQRCPEGFLLLWPLAGRDLMRQLEFTLHELALVLSASEHLHSWTRPDGRAMTGLLPKPYFQAALVDAT